MNTCKTLIDSAIAVKVFKSNTMLIKLTKDVKKSTGNGWFVYGSVLEVSDTYGRRLIAEGAAVPAVQIVDFQKEIADRFEAMQVAKIVAEEEE